MQHGLTVTMKGEGVRVFDQDGKRYLDLEAGITRPVHVGYGRKEIAQAAHDQMMEFSLLTTRSSAGLEGRASGLQSSVLMFNPT